MKKTVFFILFLSALTLSACNKTQNQPSQQGTKPDDTVLKNALNLYSQKKSEGIDLSNGPCLGKIADDWVLDIAHSPRQSLDDKQENTCADFREGRAHHFIELDPEGKLIQAH